MRDITIGQYYPAQSVVHSLDARCKILCTLALIIFVFLSGTFIGFALSFAFVLAVTLISKIPVKSLFKSLKGIYVIIIFTFVLNTFFYKEGSELLSLGFLTITSGGLLRALFMAIRLMLLIMSASLMMLTTSPIEITDGIESLLSPLKRIGFPAHEIAMMMSIALRFIPTLTEECDKIMKAQASRGAVFDEGSLIKRARAIVALVIPLLVSSFRRADELATAMEARCYAGGEGRTRLKVQKLTKRDAVAFVIVVAFCGVILVDKLILAQVFPFLAG